MMWNQDQATRTYRRSQLWWEDSIHSSSRLHEQSGTEQQKEPHGGRHCCCHGTSFPGLIDCSIRFVTRCFFSGMLSFSFLQHVVIDLWNRTLSAVWPVSSSHPFSKLRSRHKFVAPAMLPTVADGVADATGSLECHLDYYL